MEGDEEKAQENYESITKSIPEAKKLVEDENFHERSLLEMIDERRLRYTGAVVRGLNDGIVEITGEVAGLTLVLGNPALIGIIAFITGIAGAFALASSEYLAASWEEGPQTPIAAAGNSKCHGVHPHPELSAGDRQGHRVPEEGLGDARDQPWNRGHRLRDRIHHKGVPAHWSMRGLRITLDRGLDRPSPPDPWNLWCASQPE
ncbi:MAG: hypothetical protein GKC03_01810 [Methanomassiliicoccales archaeon]|nr:hypothetical protein [Methanomassiliicoccales archaeon]NYT15662.1 hypothetical protein [Methanomassiliicoccales archaeon]